MKQKSYALLSVFDKTGITELAKVLLNLNYEIISTGGTFKTLEEAGVKVIPIEEVTGNPRDSFDGRMKTVSFKIEGGILFDRSKVEHVKQAEELGVLPIDVVVCNLYPFEQKPGIETIDVGGPTMIRSAAKNFKSCVVIVDPKDYGKFEDAVRSEEVRKEFAGKAFHHLSFYDAQIGKYLSAEKHPEEMALPLRRKTILRYGENPHQQGALYETPNTNSPMAKLEWRAGRELSGTNVGDIFAGVEAVRLFSEPASVVIKHHTPCGVAIGKDARESLDRAIEADPVSAFGGIIVMNRKMDLESAKVIGKFKGEFRGNMDIVAVPEIDKDALEFLKTLRKSMGIYTFGEIPAQRSEKIDVKWFDGAAVIQDVDDGTEDSFKNWKVVTEVKPTEGQMKQLQFAWKITKAARSNSVVIVDPKLPMTRGIGTGQTSRVGACKIALEQAGKYAEGGFLASDSFFPFEDCVTLAAEHKIAAIVEQGGSINDQKSIDEANKHGIPMVFTQRRAFRH